METAPLTDLAAVIRSKNAGPYELTVDILFKNKEDYAFLKEINYFNKELFARIFGIETDKIIALVHFDPASAIKCTMVRPVVSSASGDTDIYGAQQHAPLLGLKAPSGYPGTDQLKTPSTMKDSNSPESGKEKDLGFEPKSSRNYLLTLFSTHSYGPKVEIQLTTHSPSLQTMHLVASHNSDPSECRLPSKMHMFLSI